MTATHGIYLITKDPNKKQVFILNKRLWFRAKLPHEMYDNRGRPSPIIASLPLTPATPDIISLWRLETGNWRLKHELPSVHSKPYPVFNYIRHGNYPAHLSHQQPSTQGAYLEQTLKWIKSQSGSIRINKFPKLMQCIIIRGIHCLKRHRVIWRGHHPGQMCIWSGGWRPARSDENVYKSR